MQETYIFTDLAAECRQDTQAEGVRYFEQDENGVRISHIEILDGRGRAALGKPEGVYVTLSFEDPVQADGERRQVLSRTVATHLRQMMDAAAPDARNILVVGLGNRRISADAVGPQTVDHITVTRHLQEWEPELFGKLGGRAVSALTPGVMGDTGMETADLVSCAVQTVHPDAVVVLDALAARKTERLGRTVQISDTGISPGSGVGNRRRALDRASLGVPVIAIGVPTVVNAATLVMDALSEAGIEQIAPSLEEVLSRGRSFFVVPKECDASVAALSSLLADALDLLFL